MEPSGAHIFFPRFLVIVRTSSLSPAVSLQLSSLPAQIVVYTFKLEEKGKEEILLPNIAQPLFNQK